MGQIRTLKISNESSYEPPDGPSTLRAIAQAVTIQLHDVAAWWGASVWQVVADAHKRGYHIVLFDNEDQAGDDGYHSLDPHNRPYARVFLDSIFHHNGTWVRSANSVSATVSHEACELVVDPATNRWAQSATGSMWSL